MQEKALTIGKGFAKVVISVPAVIFRAAARFFGSLGADIVCLFTGPMRLYNNIKPAGKQWIAFGFRVIGLSIYNSIALILNATLGFLYNLVESVFMMYELWTNTSGQVTVKSLYSHGVDSQENNEDLENNNDYIEDDEISHPKEVNFKWVAYFIFGAFDIDNKMSQFVNAKVHESTTCKNLTSTFYSAAGKLMGIKQTKKEISEQDIPEIDALLNPIHSFRAK